jgi:hypothetical protein
MKEKIMTSQTDSKTLQAKIKRLEFEQLCLERQLKILEQEVAKQLSDSKHNSIENNSSTSNSTK